MPPAEKYPDKKESEHVPDKRPGKTAQDMAQPPTRPTRIGGYPSIWISVNLATSTFCRIRSERIETSGERYINEPETHLHTGYFLMLLIIVSAVLACCKFSFVPNSGDRICRVPIYDFRISWPMGLTPSLCLYYTTYRGKCQGILAESFLYDRGHTEYLL